MRSAARKDLLAVAAGIAVSWVAAAAVTWILVRTGRMPVEALARIMAEAETGETPTGADTELFALLDTARWYGEWVTGPVVAAVVGLVVGWLGTTRRWLWAIIAVLPLGMLAGGVSPGRPWRGLLVMAIVSAVCGHLAGVRRAGPDR